jgi:hypothetical protein
MEWFKAMLVTVGPRLAAAAGAVVVAKAAKLGVTLDPTETTGLILGSYAAIHKAISSKVNPGDAAKGRVADAEKTASQTGGAVVVEGK